MIDISWLWSLCHDFVDLDDHGLQILGLFLIDKCLVIVEWEDLRVLVMHEAIGELLFQFHAVKDWCVIVAKSTKDIWYIFIWL